MCASLFKRAINFLGCKIPKKCTFFGVVKIYISTFKTTQSILAQKILKHPVQSSSRQTSNVAQQVWAPIAGNFRFPPKKWHVIGMPPYNAIGMSTSTRAWHCSPHHVPSWTSRSKVCRCALTCGSAMTASSAFLMRKALWTQTGRQIGKNPAKRGGTNKVRCWISGKTDSFFQAHGGTANRCF